MNVSSHINEIIHFNFWFFLKKKTTKKLLVTFWIFRNKDTDISKADVIEEIDDEASTKKKKGKKEKKKKKDYEEDDTEYLAKELDDVTIEEGRKDKKQSKVSGIFVCVSAHGHWHAGICAHVYSVHLLLKI